MIIYFMMQMMFLVFILVIVWLTTSARSMQYGSYVRFEAIEDICRKCREISDNGEVNYFAIEDLERIVEKLRFKEVVVENNTGFVIKKTLLAIPVFMITGIVGTVLFIIFYKDNKLQLTRGNIELQNMRIHTLDCALERFRELSDSGEVNYFSIEDIERVADELRHNTK